MKMRFGVGAMLVLMAFGAAAAEPFRDYPDLPPLQAVERAMASYPAVLAAQSGIKVEQANQEKLDAGPYEYSVRMGNYRRKITDPTVNQRYQEWDVNLERPFRMPGKASLDKELGKQGVVTSQWAYGDALHEAGRTLLGLWFGWYREHFQTKQWGGQVAALNQQLDAVNKRVKAGDAARLEAMLAEAALRQAEASLSQASVKERMAATALTSRFSGITLPSAPGFSDPEPLPNGPAYWREEILKHNHELGLARADSRLWQLQASRAEADRLPDPTVGIRYSSELGGNERVAGLTLTIPLPGRSRTANAQGVGAQAEMAAHREAGILQKVEGEAANTYAAASAAYETWQKARIVAEKMQDNANLMSRAYSLGEAGLSEVLLARRQALEASLNATLAQVDAAENRYRLLLDAHQLWPLDVDEGPGRAQ